MRTAIVIVIFAVTLAALRSLAAADPGSPTGAARSADAQRGDSADAAEPAARSRVTAERGPAAPPISVVLSSAYAAAGLDRDPGRGWIWRTRLAGLVPWLTVRTTRDTSWQDAHSEVGHGTTLELRATWRLDRLLFDGRELQVATIEAARRRERTRLASHVIRAYYAWRRAVEAASRPGDDRAARFDDPADRLGEARATTRIDEAVAELDALTDGWFSEELAHPRR